MEASFMSSKELSIPNRTALEKQYETRRPSYEKILHSLRETLKLELKQISLHPTIMARVKPFDSYYRKLLMRLKECKSRDQDFAITDVLGLRIICPLLTHLKVVEELTRKKFQVTEVEHKGIHLSFKEFGYESIHLLIKVPFEILSEFQVEEALVCEVQLRTILQEAWAEIEHELVYKADWSLFDDPLKRKLAALNANLTLSDILFQEIWDYHRPLQLALKKRRESFCAQIQAAADNMILGMPEGDVSWKKVQKIEMKTGDVRTPLHGDMGDKIDDLLMKALDAHNANQFKKAIDIYSAILDLKPKLPEYIQSIIYMHRGMAYFAEFTYDQALEDFSQALELNQGNYKTFYYRGITHQILENYPAALEDFNRCLQLNPYQFDALYSRAQVYFHMGDPTKALGDCEQALNIEPESLQAQKFRELVKCCIRL